MFPPVRSRSCCAAVLTGFAAVASGAAGPAAKGPPVPGVIIESFSAGGREQPLVMRQLEPGETGPGVVRNAGYRTVRLPMDAQALNFHIRPNPRAATEPTRIQYRLQGWEDEWQDLEGMMWLSLRFLDSEGRRVSSASLPRLGESPGWNGDPSTSPFRRTSEMVTVPARASRVQVFLLSGGSPRTTGIWLVQGIRILATDTARPEGRLLVEERVRRGAALDQPEGVPENWRREGTNPGTAQVFTSAGPATWHALALVDTDVRNSGSWVGGGGLLAGVEPGMTLRVETDEAFSIGRGGDYACSYHRLPAGRYTFQAIPVDAFGNPAGVGVELPILFTPPFYAAWWFWSIVAAVAVAGLTGGTRYTIRQRMRRELEDSERRRAVEAERMRIAQDLHDDMGARLTQISLASGLALRHTSPDSPAHQDLKRLDRAARDVVTVLDEIVWAVNPAHDTLEGLGNYLSQYATESTAENGLRCRLDIPALLPAHFISSGARHHLLMALKEAITNVLKHAGATEVRIALRFDAPRLVLTVADDGRGFDPATARTGHGIANLQRRLATAGGTCEIRSAPGGGTTVTFALRLGPPPPAR